MVKNDRVNLIRLKNGFTLIEILVVVAIIGILATLMFGASMVARNKAINARIQAEMNEVRTQANLIKNDTNSFISLCAVNTLNDVGYPNSLGLLEPDIAAKSGASVDCYATEGNYCVRARMVPSGGGYYCVDSTGYAGTSQPDCNGTNFVCE